MEELSAERNPLFLFPCFCLSIFKKCNGSESCLGKPQRWNQIWFTHNGLKTIGTGGCKEFLGVVQGPLPRAVWLVPLCWLATGPGRKASPFTLRMLELLGCNCDDFCLKKHCGCLQAGTGAGSHICDGFTVFGGF